MTEIGDAAQSLADVTPEQLTAWVSRGFDGVVGLRYTELTADRVRAEYDVKPSLHQPAGIVHGGVHCAVIESMASCAAGIWLDGKGSVVGVNNNTDFVRAVREGTIFGEATPIHRGRSQQLWQVVLRDGQDRIVARGQVRLQNIHGDKELAR